jgi:hypothetical protein
MRCDYRVALSDLYSTKRHNSTSVLHAFAFTVRQRSTEIILLNEHGTEYLCYVRLISVSVMPIESSMESLFIYVTYVAIVTDSISRSEVPKLL